MQLPQSLLVFINPAIVKKAKSIAYILQMEKSNRLHLALGITAKPVAGPEIDPPGIYVPFLMQNSTQFKWSHLNHVIKESGLTSLNFFNRIK